MKTFATGVAVAAVIGGAAAGVTYIAPGAPGIQPVVWDIPLPQAPAEDLQAPLMETINALGSGGSFGSKAAYIQDLGRLGKIGVEAKYNDLARKGFFPLTATVADIDQNGPFATANVTATAANGASASMPLAFVQGPSPTGWQLSKQSLGDLIAAVG